MTFYARLSGYLMYRTHDHLDAAIQRLICGAWLNTDEQWLLKGHPRQVRAESTIDHERNILVIPPGVYQNLGRITTELFAGATDGLAVTSSSDNCFDAWVETPLLDAADIPAGDGGDVSSIQCIDLEQVALANGLSIKRFGDPGHERWQRDVLDAFHAQYDPDVHEILESPSAPPE